MTLLSTALSLCPLKELGIEPKQKKNPRGWKNVFTPLAGLAVWAQRAVLALDQWDKLLESGQLWQIAQKEKSLPLQKIGFCHRVLYLQPSTIPPKKCEVKRGNVFPWSLQNIGASALWRVWLGLGACGRGGVCTGLWEERGGRFTSPVNLLSDVGPDTEARQNSSSSCR